MLTRKPAAKAETKPAEEKAKASPKTPAKPKEPAKKPAAKKAAAKRPDAKKPAAKGRSRPVRRPPSTARRSSSAKKS
jgi:hypothetical protein